MSDLDIRFELDNETDLTARMKVVGVGGAGGNAVNRMVGADVKGVDFIAINTDAQDLEASLASARVHIGTNLTKGLGAGANHEVGRQAILEDRDQVVESLRGSHLRHGWGHRHRCSSGRRRDRQRAGRADNRHRHQTFQI